MGFLEELYQKGYHPSEHDRPHSMEYELAVQRVQDLEKKIIEKMGAQFGNVKKCAVGKHPKSEKLGSAGQAACCACTHSRYFTGGSPSGLRV